jgi:hypothetical protein
MDLRFRLQGQCRHDIWTILDILMKSLQPFSTGLVKAVLVSQTSATPRAATSVPSGSGA